MFKKTLTCLLALVMLLGLGTAVSAAYDPAGTGYDVRVRSGGYSGGLTVDFYTVPEAGLKNGRFVISYPSELTLVSAASELESGEDTIADIDISTEGTVSFAWAAVEAQAETKVLTLVFKGPYDSLVDVGFTLPESGVSQVFTLEFPAYVPPAVITPAESPEPSEEPWRFNDVMSEDAWYYDAVYAAYEAGLMEGVGEDTFAPNDLLTRSALITTIYRMAGSPAVSGGSSFSDVPDGEWYTAAVVWGTENGIIEGVADGLFDPDGYVTREQVAVMMYRYHIFTGGEKTDGAGALDHFTDAGSISGWALDAMAWAVGAKVLNGVSDEPPVLNPLGTATRAEIAQILVNYKSAS